MSNSWFTCTLIPPGQPMSCLHLWFSEINSGFSLHEYKYRVHGVDWHYLGTKIKMLVPCVSIEWNNLMYIKHLAECLASVNGNWRSVNTFRYTRCTGGRTVGEWVAQVCVIGIRQSYNAALLIVNPINSFVSTVRDPASPGWLTLESSL